MRPCRRGKAHRYLAASGTYGWRSGCPSSRAMPAAGRGPVSGGVRRRSRHIRHAACSSSASTRSLLSFGSTGVSGGVVLLMWAAHVWATPSDHRCGICACLAVACRRAVQRRVGPGLRPRLHGLLHVQGGDSPCTRSVRSLEPAPQVPERFTAETFDLIGNSANWTILLVRARVRKLHLCM